MLASTYKKDEARYGKRVTDLGQRANETALSPTRPLARVQIDVTKRDLFVIDEKANLPIGRPWLVISICALTKMIIGFYLSSSKTVHGSLTNQI
jgi:putative transposase